MNVFDGNLEAVEKFGFCVLYLGNKMLGQVLVNNAVAGCKKSQHVRDEMPLPVVKVGPVFQIMAQVNLLCRPETGLCLLVVLPDVVLAYGEKNETVFVLLEDGFLHKFAHGIYF